MEIKEYEEDIIKAKDIKNFINEGYKVGIFFRHSERYDGKNNLAANDVMLTDYGKKIAENLGVALSQIEKADFYSSPIIRCVATMECIQKGMRRNAHIVKSKKLGDPGVYFDSLSEKDCGEAMEKQGFFNYSLKYLAEWKNDGCRRLDLASEELIDYIVENMKQPLSLFNSHDFLVAALMKYLKIENPTKEDFVDFLEGVVILIDEENERAFKRFKGYEKC